MTAEPDEAIGVTESAKAPAVLSGGSLDRDGLWDLWRRLTEEFRFARLARHLLRSRSGWGLYGVDVISTLKSTPMGIGAGAILAGLDTTQLTALLGIARINAARNEALWKLAALFYVSGPVTAILASFQIAPEFTRMVMLGGGFGFALIIIGLSGSLLGYYKINWRAGQVAALIELELVERAQIVMVSAPVSAE